MFILVFLLFLGILVGANVYLAKRFAFYFSLDRALVFYILFPLITFFMIGGTMGATNAVSTTGHYLFIIASTTMGFILYLLIATIVVDLMTLMIKIRPVYYGLAALSIAALISGYGLWNATNVKITEVDIRMKGLSKPIRAAHLTDTHLGHIRGPENLKRIVNLINSQQVDVVFFTGDLLDSKFQLKKESMDPLAGLNAPVFFVEGNHDGYTGVEAIKGYLRKIGVNVVQNELIAWGDLQIIGLDFMVADSNSMSPHASSNGPTVQNVLSHLPIDKNKPAVLLHHGPNGIKYANEAGIDLYLAGHTHAGQLWPATHVAKMIFEYNKGLHDYQGTKVYVSQGTGTFGPPMRVGTNAELTMINLKPE
jgi:predicted MPP superfamily phosphohydrolase